jgi:hypothetical protein
VTRVATLGLKARLSVLQVTQACSRHKKPGSRAGADGKQRSGGRVGVIRSLRPGGGEHLVGPAVIKALDGLVGLVSPVVPVGTGEALAECLQALEALVPLSVSFARHNSLPRSDEASEGEEGGEDAEQDNRGEAHESADRQSPAWLGVVQRGW